MYHTSYKFKYKITWLAEDVFQGTKFQNPWTSLTKTFNFFLTDQQYQANLVP